MHFGEPAPAERDANGCLVVSAKRISEVVPVRAGIDPIDPATCGTVVIDNAGEIHVELGRPEGLGTDGWDAEAEGQGADFGAPRRIRTSLSRVGVSVT